MAGGILSWQTTAPSTTEAVAIGRERDELSNGELETLYLIRRPEMIRFLIRFGVDVVEAEDITQEVFLNAFDQPSKRPDNLFHWALACARNLAVNRYHRSQREISAPAERWKRWEATLADGREDQEALVCRKECQLRLVQAFSQLAPVEQQCLVMRSRGVTFREIAATHDLSLQSAVYTTDNAIKKLQRKLQTAKR